jgi:hypothetical protein
MLEQPGLEFCYNSFMRTNSGSMRMTFKGDVPKDLRVLLNLTS